MDDSVVKIQSMLYTHSRVYNTSNKTNTINFR